MRWFEVPPFRLMNWIADTMSQSTNRPNRNEDTGQYEPKFPDEEFIDALGNHEYPTTSAVASDVGCGYRNSYKRLKKLEEEGRVEGREIGKSLVWFDQTATNR